VLYLAPTKALAADQARRIRALKLPMPPAAALDGDTTAEERRWIRDFGAYILSNPDMLHYSLLPDHRRWASFFKRLRYVVVDECHAYRGAFGSHVAAVLRRLRRICEHYGADPVFALASATAAEPETAAGRLTGLPVLPVAVDGSPRGELLFALWEPPLTERRGEGGAPLRRSAIAESAGLLADLVRDQVRTVAFVRSRKGAEVVSVIARDQLGAAEGAGPDAEAQEGLKPDQAGPGSPKQSLPASAGPASGGPVSADPVSAGRPPAIAAYRAGYLREDRRTLEANLLSGRLTGLAATNALELGVDFAGLDAVVMAGYPGTRSSLWQQAGRAGRGGGDALAVLVARDDPLDTYLVHHPEALFGKPVEHTVLNPDNPYVLWPHLCAAAAELPLTRADLGLFGPTAPALAEQLAGTGWLRQRTTGWYWTRPERASDLADLRGAGGTPVRIVEQSTGRLLGRVDAAAAHGTVHEGAVYLHQGETYLVRTLDLDEATALVEAARPGYTTTAREISDLRITGEDQARDHCRDVRLALGSVEVTSRVIGFQRRDTATGAILDEEPLDLPERTLRTKAVWWTCAPEALERAQLAVPDVPGAAHAAEHAAIGLLPLFAECDRWDIGGLSSADHADTGQATIFVHDGLPGGGGFAERGFERAAAWLAATQETIRACECPSGCPSCVQSPKCGNGNQPLDKPGAYRLLGVLLEGC
jgi:DEAD/DEAH box helicase domain-containing protein